MDVFFSAACANSASCRRLCVVLVTMLVENALLSKAISAFRRLFRAERRCSDPSLRSEATSCAVKGCERDRVTCVSRPIGRAPDGHGHMVNGSKLGAAPEPRTHRVRTPLNMRKGRQIRRTEAWHGLREHDWPLQGAWVALSASRAVHRRAGCYINKDTPLFKNTAAENLMHTVLPLNTNAVDHPKHVCFFMYWNYGACNRGLHVYCYCIFKTT